ncbi:MAG: hypothetical protein AAF637_21160, partial [Pseudomonadota bacterium]
GSPILGTGEVVASLDDLIKAQGNLEHWRTSLVTRLNRAVGNALRRVHERSPVSATRQVGPPAGPIGAVDACEPDLTPPDLGQHLTHVVGLIGDVAAQTSLVGLKASLACIKLAGSSTSRAGPDERHGPAGQVVGASEALAAVAGAANAVTEQVGAAISDINSVALQTDRDLAAATADVMQRITKLGEALTAIRDGDWQHARGTG